MAKRSSKLLAVFLLLGLAAVSLPRQSTSLMHAQTVRCGRLSSSWHKASDACALKLPVLPTRTQFRRPAKLADFATVYWLLLADDSGSSPIVSLPRAVQAASRSCRLIRLTHSSPRLTQPISVLRVSRPELLLCFSNKEILVRKLFFIALVNLSCLVVLLPASGQPSGPVMDMSGESQLHAGNARHGLRQTETEKMNMTAPRS